MCLKTNRGPGATFEGTKEVPECSWTLTPGPDQPPCLPAAVLLRPSPTRLEVGARQDE